MPGIKKEPNVKKELLGFLTKLKGLFSLSANNRQDLEQAIAILQDAPARKITKKSTQEFVELVFAENPSLKNPDNEALQDKFYKQLKIKAEPTETKRIKKSF